MNRPTPNPFPNPLLLDPFIFPKLLDHNQAVSGNITPSKATQLRWRLLTEQATLAAANLDNTSAMFEILYPHKRGVSQALKHAAMVAAEAAQLLLQEGPQQ